MHRQHMLGSQVPEREKSLPSVHVVFSVLWEQAAGKGKDCEVDLKPPADVSKHRFVIPGVPCEVDALRTGQQISLVTRGGKELQPTAEITGRNSGYLPVPQRQSFPRSKHAHVG